MATRKSIEEQIEEQEKKKQQLEARIKQLKARQSATERKERTRRLIEVGAIVEKGIGIELKEKEQREALLSLLTKKRKDRNGNDYTTGGWLFKQLKKEMEESEAAEEDTNTPQKIKPTPQGFYSVLNSNNDNKGD